MYRDIISKILSVILTLVVIGLAFYSITASYLRINADTEIRLLYKNDGGVFYKVTDTNQLQCDLATVSSLVHKMEADGYKVIKVTSDKGILDITNSNGEIVNRLHYENGLLTNISAPYEKSYVPLTYITEESY